MPPKSRYNEGSKAKMLRKSATKKHWMHKSREELFQLKEEEPMHRSKD